MLGRYLNRSEQGERIREVIQIVPSGPSQAVPRTPKRVIRRLDATRMAELVQGYLDGVPVDELAVRFNVNPSTVQKHVRSQGLPRRSPRLGPTHIEDAAQLYLGGESLLTLGKRYGIGKDAVARSLRKAGVKLRRRNGWRSPGDLTGQRSDPQLSVTSQPCA